MTAIRRGVETVSGTVSRIIFPKAADMAALDPEKIGIDYSHATRPVGLASV
jgi:hypothetical protein